MMVVMAVWAGQVSQVDRAVWVDQPKIVAFWVVMAAMVVLVVMAVAAAAVLVAHGTVYLRNKAMWNQW